MAAVQLQLQPDQTSVQRLRARAVQDLEQLQAFCSQTYGLDIKVGVGMGWTSRLVWVWAHSTNMHAPCTTPVWYAHDVGMAANVGHGLQASGLLLVWQCQVCVEAERLVRASSRQLGNVHA